MTKDPYKYFRTEAREILDGLSQGALDLEKGEADKQRVGDLLRLAHTLKGAARVVKQPDIADLAHAVEDILSPYREIQGSVPGEQAGAMLHLLDRITSRLVTLDAPAQSPTAAPPRPRSEEPFETVRVEVEDVEELLGSLSQANMHFTALQGGVNTLGRARELAGAIVRQLHSLSQNSNGSTDGKLRRLADDLLDSLGRQERGFTSGMERLERELSQTRERANRLRLLPSSAIFPSLARAARDAAFSLGKPVEWQASGGDIRLEAQVLVVIRDALLHLVRNAVAHGIEAEGARAAAGKPPMGHVEIKIQRRGNRVVFLCRDDGGGIDVAAVRRAAVRKGAISAADADSLGLEEAIHLILHAGVSTTETVTGISGRGIGLDVVRSTVEQLKGKISVETTGRGTTVEVCVPVSVTSVEALMVESAGMMAAIPLEAARRTMRISSQEIAVSGNQRLITFDGQAVPFLELSEALGRQTSAAAGRRSWPCVIVSSGSAVAAVGVDRLFGMSTVLVRSAPAVAGVQPVVAGACLDAEGNPQLVLDPENLMRVAHQACVPASPPRGTVRPPILIVDDSLTTRMVEQSILESAGHRVELATSAEEALEKAHRQPFGLFLVDVEMPGMNGFEFIAKTREDPVLKEIPAILVTSRNSADDRRRGQEAGARAYIVKSEFNQDYLLQTIEQLMR